MKTVMLLRHGKSDWGAEHETDHERPLADRGRKAAHLIGRFLRTSGVLPDLILTSTARRARETLQIVLDQGELKVPIEETPELYGVSAKSVFSLFQQQDDFCSSLLLVGHNPTWEELTSEMVGGGSFRLPTAALVCVDFPVSSWKSAFPGTGNLRFLVIPKILKKLN